MGDNESIISPLDIDDSYVKNTTLKYKTSVKNIITKIIIGCLLSSMIVSSIIGIIYSDYMLKEKTNSFKQHDLSTNWEICQCKLHNWSDLKRYRPTITMDMFCFIPTYNVTMQIYSPYAYTNPVPRTDLNQTCFISKNPAKMSRFYEPRYSWNDITEHGLKSIFAFSLIGIVIGTIGTLFALCS